MPDPIHSNLTEEQKKKGCPFTAMSNKVESKVDMQKLNKLNKILSESWSLDKLLRAIAYGTLFIKGILLKVGASEQGNLIKLISDLYGKLSTTRFINHVIGAPAQLAAAVAQMKGPSTESEDDKKRRKLKVLQHLAMFFYFPFEHMIMFSRLEPKVLPFGSDAGWLRRTCMAWTVFNASAALEAVLRAGNGTLALPKTEDDQLRLSTLIFDLVLAISWSKVNPFLGPIGIGAIGCYGGAVGFYLRWKAEP